MAGLADSLAAVAESVVGHLVEGSIADVAADTAAGDDLDEVDTMAPPAPAAEIGLVAEVPQGILVAIASREVAENVLEPVVEPELGQDVVTHTVAAASAAVLAALEVDKV